PKTQAAVSLRNRGAEPSLHAHRLPQHVIVALGRIVQHCANPLHGALNGKKSARRILQHLLLVRVIEIHRPPPPSSRSQQILRASTVHHIIVESSATTASPDNLIS